MVIAYSARKSENKIASWYTEMAVESDDSVSDIIRAAASSFGYAEIRLLQDTAVRAFVTGSDVFLSISTGGGKSLCYAVLSRVLDMLRGNDTSQSLVILVSLASYPAWVRGYRQSCTDERPIAHCAHCAVTFFARDTTT